MNAQQAVCVQIAQGTGQHLESLKLKQDDLSGQKQPATKTSRTGLLGPPALLDGGRIFTKGVFDQSLNSH